MITPRSLVSQERHSNSEKLRSKFPEVRPPYAVVPSPSSGRHVVKLKKGTSATSSLLRRSTRGPLLGRLQVWVRAGHHGPRVAVGESERRRRGRVIGHCHDVLAAAARREVHLCGNQPVVRAGAEDERIVLVGLHAIEQPQILLELRLISTRRPTMSCSLPTPL